MRSKSLLAIVIAFFITGCAHGPKKLGVSDLEWSSYSSEKQQRLLENYDQIVKERAKITGQETANAQHDSLAVNIHDGKVMMPPAFINWQYYQPVSVTIADGECRDVELKHRTDEDIKTSLIMCYHNDVLYLDPSRYDLTKKLGTVRIHATPLWLSGFNYQGIHSQGYVRLNNVTVEVKLVKPKDTNLN